MVAQKTPPRWHTELSREEQGNSLMGQMKDKLDPQTSSELRKSFGKPRDKARISQEGKSGDRSAVGVLRA